MSFPPGLTAAEVEVRRARGDANAVRKETSRTYGGIFRANLLNVFNIAVFSIAAVLAVLFVTTSDIRTLYDAIAISSVAFLNTVIGIVQEVRAKIALDRITALARATATVVRDGQPTELPVDDLVVDDVIRLTRGDQIPVDGRMLASRYCEVDESLLTGESLYIFKGEGDQVLSGSFCVAGEGFMVAERVGEDAYVHRLTREVRSYKRFLTPLQRQVDRLVQILVATAAVMALLVVLAAVVRAASPGASSKMLLLIETTRSVASIVTSMVPIGLILLSTVAFALGIFRISRRGALVQKLNAVESFANVDVICMDKTGTLTRNQLRVERLTPAPDHPPETFRRVVLAFAHHCTEKNATIVALAEHGEAAQVEVLDEIPFNSRDKLSGLAFRLDGEPRHVILGALEALQDRLPEADRATARAVLDESPGRRHLVVVELPPDAGDLRAAVAAHATARLLGVVSLGDEIRPNIAEVLEGFAARGIELKVVSGDAPETVRAVAEASGWRESTERVVTGADLDGMSPEALSAAARTCSLFARVSPRNKQDLVAALQDAGHYVAMVGDGVNDVLALKKAELGIAMGAGNRMSKDVSDIVLLDNDFAVLPRVLQEGATIVANVQSAAKLFLTKNVYAVLLILATGFVGLTFPFVPRHVTIIGFFAISIPALLLAFTRRIVQIPPHFLKDVLRFTAISGGCIALAGLTSYFIAMVGLGASVEQARTVLLTQIVLLSLLNFLIIVGGSHLLGNLKRNSGMVLFALGFGVLYLALVFLVTGTEALGGLARFLEIAPLGAAEVGMALGLTAVAGTAMVLGHRGVLRRAELAGEQPKSVEITSD